jgi:hypothetical protein
LAVTNGATMNIFISIVSVTNRVAVNILKDFGEFMNTFLLGVPINEIAVL